VLVSGMEGKRVRVSSKKTLLARLPSGGNECGVWIVEEDPRARFGNGRDVGADI
jgi:hypothetical protein